MAWTVMNALGSLFDALLYPFKGLHPVVGLAAISIVTGVVMLVIFGKTTNQRALRAVKGKIVASIIEIWLFKDKPGLMLGAAGRILRHNLNYLRYSLVAVVFVIVPVVLIMVQLGVRYSHRPLHPDEEAIVSITLDRSAAASIADVELVAPDGIEIVTPALRIEDEGEADWRVKAVKPGDYELVFRGPGFEARKRIAVVENSLMPLAPVRAKSFTWNFFLYPAEKPLPGDSPVKSLSVEYPLSSLGGSWGFPVWLWIFFVVSVAAGFALKGVFKVEV